MTNSATLNRTLFLEDNLPVLRRLDSDSIAPIATDPPFNKGVGALEGTKKAGDDLESKDVRTGVMCIRIGRRPSSKTTPACST